MITYWESFNKWGGTVVHVYRSQLSENVWSTLHHCSLLGPQFSLSNEVVTYNWIYACISHLTSTPLDGVWQYQVFFWSRTPRIFAHLIQLSQLRFAVGALSTCQQSTKFNYSAKCVFFAHMQAMWTVLHEYLWNVYVNEQFMNYFQSINGIRIPGVSSCMIAPDDTENWRLIDFVLFLCSIFLELPCVHFFEEMRVV